MRYPPNFLDEIRARLPMSQIARKRVALKKQGREWRGLSPFTSEKTPSFFVNDQKMRWFDFSSGKSGNIFDFVMETEGLSFREAVERLASEAGVTPPLVSREEEAAEARRTDGREVLEAATAFFQNQLQQSHGARARGYLADRGLGARLQTEFRLGFAPKDRHALRDHLANKGFGLQAMIEAGLLVHGPDIPVAYDRFRDRIMFPICDRRGAAIAFGARALDKDAPAKYLNSPETELFHKGDNLYNQHRARAAAHKSDRILVVEGYVDVIALHGAGFPETVAPLGTALTPQQCQLLWRMSEEPILCFDGDRAGRKAAFRAVDIALSMIGPGRSLRFAFLPDGLDPDDLVRAHGPEAVDDLLKNARPLVEVLWTREWEAVQPVDTPERRAAFERRAMEAVKAIPDETLRRHYHDDFSRRLGDLFGRPAPYRSSRPENRFHPGTMSRRTLEGWRTGNIGPISASLARSSVFSPTVHSLSPREALIVALMARDPQAAADHAEELAALNFASPDVNRLRDVILAHIAESPDGELEAVSQAGLAEVLERAQKLAPPVFAGKAEEPPLDVGALLKQALGLHRRFGALHRELRAAETALAEAEGDTEFELSFARLRDIQAQIADLDGVEASNED